ncbi:Dephospho-CoA kinase [archaeon HR06]|nr:Dephospho-CoA kinase [archaeon HR06]
MKKLLICITGMPGSGKTTVANFAKEKGMEVISMGEEVRNEAIKRNYTIDAKGLALTMLKLREERGAAAVAELCLPKINSSKAPVIVIDGVRSLEEIKIFRKVGKVKILAIHASPSRRLKFLKKRGREDAPLSKEDLDERDIRELKVGLGEAIALADEVLSNNFINLKELKRRANLIFEMWLNEHKNKC